MPGLNFVWVIAAFITFNSSQLVSAGRMKSILNTIQLNASMWFHIKLFYFGMLYNIILPGGVSGDASKVVVLSSTFKKRTKSIIKAVFLDRLSGLLAIMALLCPLIIATDLFGSRFLNYGIITAALGIYPLYYVFNRYFFRAFVQGFFQVNLFALVVQILQLACVMCILYSMKVTANDLNYLLIFLVSSVATIIPVTIGGLGMREAVFLYASNWLAFDKETAVTLALLFFVITALSSLMGLLVNFKRSQQ